MAAPLLQDLVIVVAVAAAMTLLFHRLRQPVVLGYLLAGILIGPFTPPFSLVTDRARIEELAQLGLIFLMFALGLEFNLRKLRFHGARAMALAAIEVTGMIAIGFAAGRALGWDVTNSLFLGALLASTSTAILAKVLQDMGLIREEFAQAALAVTILEDIIVLLVSVFLESSAAGAPSPALVLTTLTRVGVFMLMVVSLGLLTVPRLIDWVHRQDVDELMVVAVVGIAFAGAFLASVLGFNLALGAFLAGTLVSESRAALRVTTRVNPIRDLFASTFFVAVGMMLDPRLIWTHLHLVLLVTLIALGGKILVNYVAAWLLGHDGRTSLRIGIAMAQMGEWALIVAALGATLGATEPVLYPVAVGACALTMFLAPHLLRHSGAISTAAADHTPRALHKLGEAYRRTLSSFRLRRGSTSTKDSRIGSRSAILGASVIGLFLVAAALLRLLESRLPTTPFDDAVRPTLGLLVVGLIGLPLLLVFGQEMSLWSTAYARRYHLRPQSLSRRRVVSTHAIRLTATIAAPVALYLTGLALASVTIHPILIPRIPIIIGAVLLVLGAAGFALYPFRLKLHAWFVATLDLLMTPTKAERADPARA